MNVGFGKLVQPYPDLPPFAPVPRNFEVNMDVEPKFAINKDEKSYFDSDDESEELERLR